MKEDFQSQKNKKTMWKYFCILLVVYVFFIIFIIVFAFSLSSESSSSKYEGLWSESDQGHEIDWWITDSKDNSTKNSMHLYEGNPIKACIIYLFKFEYLLLDSLEKLTSNFHFDYPVIMMHPEEEEINLYLMRFIVRSFQDSCKIKNNTKLKLFWVNITLPNFEKLDKKLSCFQVFFFQKSKIWII